MDTLPTLALDSIKAMLLLVFASGVVLALHRRSARLRAVVWSVALAGSLAIPLVAPLLPVWSLPMPEAIARIVAPGPAEETQSLSIPATSVDFESSSIEIAALSIAQHPAPVREFPWHVGALMLWGVVASGLLARVGIGLRRVGRAVRRAVPVTDDRWLRHLENACTTLGYRRRVRLVSSPEVEVPATVGVLRPVVVLPPGSAAWLDDRRQAVLLHELVHVARFDWMARMIARIARAVYWFNPLAWWAVRRLDLEQELACDEEVLALGTGASDYACHLLGIARHAMPTPAPAIPALGMARTTHLEERIMTILKRTTHRRVGLAVIIPAALLMAAMVPALASVYPGDTVPRPASSEIKEILAEMEAAEEKIEPYLAKIEDMEIEFEPQIEALADVEVTIDDERIAEIEARMEPYLERIEAIEINMEPYHEKLEEFEKAMEEIELHIEDGTLNEIHRQIQEQMSKHMELMEDIHIDMEPYHEQLEAIHKEMEPLYEELAGIHVDMEPIHAHIEDLHIKMEPFHHEMEKIHIELEPFHEEMEILGSRLEKAIRSEVVVYLRSELGAVTSPGAPLDEAGGRIVEDAHINVDDGVLKIMGDEKEIAEILNDLLLPHRVGTQDNFDFAIQTAATGLSPMVIAVE